MTVRALPLLLCTLLVATGISACDRDGPTPSSPTSVAAEGVADPEPADSASPAAEESGADRVASQADGADEQNIDLSGHTIAIDPGHNGGNASHPAEINRPVPDGRGGTKACNTTGTATADDYAEADFTWAVSQDLTDSLEAAGAEVVLSRTDNEGVGPCVDERGTFADDADLLVSIHANGTESTSVEGFHVIIAEPGSDERAEQESERLAKAMSRALAEDFTPNPAFGEDAISRRRDLAGLNNASVPAVIVECGEMRNPAEAKLMDSEAGQEQYAAALMQGIIDWY